ncbi:hypothetical protein GCM10017786_21140 [Amycolatopsis deserti]|uniref:Uncharacterized protein n=1 Tax=Amycolatopsis deserti TaxID=185696 RepID=A0ABQ3IMN5_9PSEU|nr:hypothetical protein [Amycolatopsis deserti]GHE88889.1 hypothetical protein GCM10017786_21140 [Amycolatopsis deserti]
MTHVSAFAASREQRAVATPRGYVAYSGSNTAWAPGEQLLNGFGTTRFSAGPAGLSPALPQGMAEFYITSLNAFIE